VEHHRILEQDAARREDYQASNQIADLEGIVRIGWDFQWVTGSTFLEADHSPLEESLHSTVVLVALDLSSCADGGSGRDFRGLEGIDFASLGMKIQHRGVVVLGRDSATIVDRRVESVAAAAGRLRPAGKDYACQE
jgi:hypothetical protein